MTIRCYIPYGRGTSHIDIEIIIEIGNFCVDLRKLLADRLGNGTVRECRTVGCHTVSVVEVQDLLPVSKYTTNITIIL